MSKTVEVPEEQLQALLKQNKDYKAKEEKIREVFTELAGGLGFLAEDGKLKPEVKEPNFGFNDVLKIMGVKLSSLPMILTIESRRNEFFGRFSAIKKLGPLIEDYI